MRAREPRLHGAGARAREAFTAVKGFVVELDRSRAMSLAAETAFWLFLSLIPLAAVAGLIAARLSVGNWQVSAPLLIALPPSARDLVFKELGNVSAWDGGAVGVTSALVFVWLASSGVHSIFDSLEAMSGGQRPWWRKRLLAIATCVGLSIGVALLALLGPGLDAIGTLLSGALGGAPDLLTSTAGRLARFLVSAVIAFGLICGLYVVGVPREEGRRMPIVPGALLATALQIALGLLYGVYIRQLGDGGAYQAGLAVIGVALTALFLIALSLVTGAMLNRIIGCRMRGLADVTRPGTCAPSPS